MVDSTSRPFSHPLTTIATTVWHEKLHGRKHLSLYNYAISCMSNTTKMHNEIQDILRSRHKVSLRAKEIPIQASRVSVSFVGRWALWDRK